MNCCTDGAEQEAFMGRFAPFINIALKGRGFSRAAAQSQ
jgi:hypothetical protein